MVLIQIYKNCYKSVSEYIITKAGWGIRLSLKIGTSPKSGLEKSEIAYFNLLETLLAWVVASLSCAVALLRTKNLFGSLRATKPRKRFF